ncbi:MAG TPA: FHA domain-containing protein [Candidatus Cloacimonadota bacterium]|nr:FHA domain-containing protein [Candidatus Cloacimonadota bacterium]
MKCPQCNVENPAGSQFCKKCGTPLQPQYKVCPNGHNYEASLDMCPHCPSNRNQSTVMMSDSSRIVPAADNLERTRIDTGTPQMKPIGMATAGDPREKTVIIGAGKPGLNEGIAKPSLPVRQLVGWLVTFDIQQGGIDYRLYQGRHIIGRSARCDIVLTVPGVSEEHAILLNRDGKFIIQDNLSANGTFVNGELIEDKRVLKENDVITIANVNLKIKMV